MFVSGGIADDRSFLDTLKEDAAPPLARQAEPDTHCKSKKRAAKRAPSEAPPLGGTKRCKKDTGARPSARGIISLTSYCDCSNL